MSNMSKVSKSQKVKRIGAAVLALCILAFKVAKADSTCLCRMQLQSILVETIVQPSFYALRIVPLSGMKSSA